MSEIRWRLLFAAMVTVTHALPAELAYSLARSWVAREDVRVEALLEELRTEKPRLVARVTTDVSFIGSGEALFIAKRSVFCLRASTIAWSGNGGGGSGLDHETFKVEERY